MNNRNEVIEHSNESRDDTNSSAEELEQFEMIMKLNEENISFLKPHFPQMFTAIDTLRQHFRKHYFGKTLDIYVYRTPDERIEIRFDIITQVNSKSLIESILPHKMHSPFIEYSRNPEYFDKKLAHQTLEEVLYYTDKNNYMFKESDITTTLIEDVDSDNYYLSSITYQLSTSPHVVLNWLGCLSNYLTHHLLKFECIHLKNNINAAGMYFVDKNKRAVSMKDYIKYENINHECILLKLLESIISLKSENTNVESSDAYVEVIKKIEKITNLYRQGREADKPFLEYIEIENYCNSLYPETTQIVLNKETAQSYKMAELLNLSYKLLLKNQKSELNYYFKCLNHLMRKKLFASSIGKAAHDGGHYSWEYAEWFFIQYAEFSIKNEKLSIINIPQNPGYQDTYAKGKVNHDIFRTEMAFWAKTLGLEFDPSSNFHTQITFTRESTKKLEALGFGLVDKIKKLIYRENRLSLFTPKVKNDFGQVAIIAPLPTTRIVPAPAT